VKYQLAVTGTIVAAAIIQSRIRGGAKSRMLGRWPLPPRDEQFQIIASARLVQVGNYASSPSAAIKPEISSSEGGKSHLTRTCDGNHWFISFKSLLLFCLYNPTTSNQ
jgi:hypothetical protein